MSKMSQLHAELSEQATDLGYESLELALEDGWCVDYDEGRLYKRIDVQEEAHKAWLEEREEVLGELISVYNDIDAPKDLKKYIKHAIEFIKKGEM